MEVVEYKFGGKMAKIIVSFRRHSIPDKDPKTGASLDSLCKEGHELAKVEGAKLAYENVIGYHSGLNRAEQTLKGIYEGSKHPNSPSEISELLKPLVADREKTMLKALKDDDGKIRDATALDNYLLDKSHLQPTDETLYKAGERLYSHLLAILEKAAEYPSDNKELYVENVTHAPVADGGILYLYLQATGQTLTDIGVIGGGFDPCNQYLVTANVQDGKVQEVIHVSYKGHEFDLNLRAARIPSSLEILLTDSVSNGSERQENNNSGEASA